MTVAPAVAQGFSPAMAARDAVCAPLQWGRGNP